MTPTEKEQLWNCIMKMRSMPWRGPRGGVYNWTQREMRKLYEKLVVYGDANEPTAAWRLLNEGKYKYMIYPWYRGQIYSSISFVPPCDDFRYATVSSVFGASLYDFTGWTIDGLDFNSNYVAVAASKGCSTNFPPTNLAEPFFGQEVIFWYYGTVDPVFTVLDNIGNPITLNWRTICTKTCYETQIPGPLSFITDIVSGVDFSTFTIFPNKTWGANLDVSNPSNVTAAESYYKQLSGASTTITSTYDSINDIYIVQIKDTYLAYSPTWGSFPFYEIPCP